MHAYKDRCEKLGILDEEENNDIDIEALVC